MIDCPGDVHGALIAPLPGGLLGEGDELSPLARLGPEPPGPPSDVIGRSQRTALVAVARDIGDDEVVEAVVRISRPGDEVVDRESRR